MQLFRKSAVNCSSFIKINEISNPIAKNWVQKFIFLAIIRSQRDLKFDCKMWHEIAIWRFFVKMIYFEILPIDEKSWLLSAIMKSKHFFSRNLKANWIMRPIITLTNISLKGCKNDCYGNKNLFWKSVYETLAFHENSYEVFLM